jgi:hypothetical protein
MEKMVVATHPENKIEIRVVESEFMTQSKQCYFMKDIFSEDPLSPLADMSMISEINSILKWREAYDIARNYISLVGKSMEFEEYLKEKSMNISR